MPDAGRERRHPPGAGVGWSEAWHFDWPGGHARLTLLPNQRVARWSSALRRPGEPLVVLDDDDVPLPPAHALEIRTSGLWAALFCETPFVHWTVGLEGFALAFDDPADAERGVGERVPLGFDLEWEAVEPPVSDDHSDAQACAVSGEVLLGSDVIAIEATGQRWHRWDSS